MYAPCTFPTFADTQRHIEQIRLAELRRYTCLGGHTWTASSPSSCCPQCDRRASAEVPSG